MRQDKSANSLKRTECRREQDDREKTGLVEKEVVIDPQGKVKNEDLEKLVENLADVKASPIRVIKNNLEKVNP